jgi:diguanylate cyclase (GGDEF)-like protein/PAS domain S-box-containing protein
MAVLADISDLMAGQQAIRASERRLRAIFDGVRDCAIFSLDTSGRIDSWNRSGEQLLGHAPGEILGSTTDALHAPGEQGTTPLPGPPARRGTWTGYQGWYQHRNGARFWGEENLSALTDDQGDLVGFSVVVRDTTDRHEAEESLRAQADTDALTGLPNRRRFDDLLAREIERFRRHGSLLSVIVIDVESFRILDNARSQQLRGLVLQEIARTCRENLRAIDSVARLGGGLFAVLLPVTDAAGALVAARRLRRATSSTLHRHGDPATRFTLALGVATVHPATRDAAELMEDVARALHEASRNGRNRIVVHPYPL